MADIKISALPGASTLDGTETIPLVQGGTTKKVTTDQFLIKDASGNVGVGAVPSAVAATTKTLQFEYGSGVTRATGGDLNINNNAYNSASNVWKYHTSGLGASRYQQDFGTHKWLSAPSGTAGATASFTTAMALDASGNLLVGTTSGAMHTFQKSTAGNYAAKVINAAASTPYGISVNYTGVTGGAGNAFFACNDDSTRFSILGNGNAQNVNNSYGAISDEKLKENITDASTKLSKLMQVRIVNYTLKSDPDKTKLIGVVAQELEKVSPGLIEETADFEMVKKTREVEVPAIEAVDAVLDEEGNVVTPAVEAVPATTRTEEYTERVDLGTTTKSVKYSVFVPMLIKAVQEQQTQIESLATRLAALEAK